MERSGVAIRYSALCTPGMGMFNFWGVSPLRESHPLLCEYSKGITASQRQLRHREVGWGVCSVKRTSGCGPACPVCGLNATKGACPQGGEIRWLSDCLYGKKPGLTWWC